MTALLSDGSALAALAPQAPVHAPDRRPSATAEEVAGWELVAESPVFGPKLRAEAWELLATHRGPGAAAVDAYRARGAARARAAERERQARARLARAAPRPAPHSAADVAQAKEWATGNDPVLKPLGSLILRIVADGDGRPEP